MTGSARQKQSTGVCIGGINLQHSFFSDFKRNIKRFLDTAIGKDELLLSDIKGSPTYISFDIFDTLLLRNVSEPADVFRIMGERLEQPKFYEQRTSAEQNARIHAPGHEVTIDEIYRQFENLTPTEREQYIALELDTEKQLCHADEKMLRFYHQCREHYPIVLISDMYMPETLMRKLLLHCGITGFRKLYISCDFRSSKRSGALYDYVLSNLGISAGSLLHIGNDFVSDDLVARKKGVRVLKVKTRRSS